MHPDSQSDRKSTSDIHQKPVSTIGSPLQPKRGPITGNPNQMERGKISGEPESGPRKTVNLGPFITHRKPAKTLGSPSQPKSGPITGNPNQMERGKIFWCCLCQFYRRSCIKHECFQINGDFSGNWNHLTTFEPIYEDEVVVDTANRD